MTTNEPLEIVVVGAGLIGLTTGVLLAKDGHRVTVLDRDAAPPPAAAEDAWTHWDRPGVNQFRQPHLMLPRWRHEMERELPELLEDLSTAGAPRVNILHLQSERVTHGWQPGDEAFDTITARRPVLEAALSRVAETQSGLEVRRGVGVTGLIAFPAGTPHIEGVCTPDGDLSADLVIDAAGRRTPVPGWVADLGGPAPEEVREPSGFIYYSRHYRCVDGRMPVGRGFVLTHHPSYSVLTLPGDLGTFCVVVVSSSKDRQLRVLRHEREWLAAVRTSPVAAHWLDHGTPITNVTPLAGIEDIQRSYVRAGRPIVTGLIAVGDSMAATNPSLGRGATIGVLHACALRDCLAEGTTDPVERVTRFGKKTAQRVQPWVEMSMRFDRHRLAEMDAEVAGTTYSTDDPTWAMTTALIAGANRDPVLARASSRIAGLLATPPEIFSSPEVQTRIGPYLAGPRYWTDHPSRAELLKAIAGAGVPAHSSA